MCLVEGPTDRTIEVRIRIPPEDRVSDSFSLLRFFGVTVAVALVIPPMVFVASGVVAGMGLAVTGGALAEQYSADRLNLLVLGGVGVIPFAFLAIALALFRRFVSADPVRSMAFGGGPVVALLLLWAHGSYWPSFLPERVAPMWPHGIEFVIVPLFFAPVGAIVGMLAGWLVHRSGTKA